MRKWVTRMREKHMDDVSRTHTHIHTYIQKYSDFLVYTISVGLAQARPNYCKFFKKIAINKFVINK